MSSITPTKASFLSNGIKVAGHLYLPTDLKSGQKCGGIVVVHPFTGVKEQTSGLYAGLLANEGYVTLAFDAAYQGESEGTPHGLENPYQRAEDIFSAVSFLRSRPEVDPERIGILGICAGGGYTIFASRTDSRIKAVATVSAACLGSFFRDGLHGTQTPEGRKYLADLAAKDRDARARGEKPDNTTFMPTTAEGAKKAGSFTESAFDYYRTPRGGHKRATSMYPACTLDLLLGFDAFQRAAQISPRPLLMIAGTEAETRYFSQSTIEQAGGPKELFLIEKANHFTLYDHTDKSLPKLKEFFAKNL